jgi:hypothetical protein
MFVQHHPAASPTLPTKLFIPTEDFELFIQEKSQQKIKGTIRFTYLNESFTANIFITPATIKMQVQQGFEGIRLNAPVLSSVEIAHNNYVLNGTITNRGRQNIVWLILDFIHLYNLLRLKPGTLLELYREAFGFAKTQDSDLVFGKIDIHHPIAQQVAKVLGQKWKRRHKYEFGNALDLLASVQDLLANYPLQFSKQAPTQAQNKVNI